MTDVWGIGQLSPVVGVCGRYVTHLLGILVYSIRPTGAPSAWNLFYKGSVYLPERAQ